MNYFTPATGTVRHSADAWGPAALSAAYDRGACGKALLEAVVAETAIAGAPITTPPGAGPTSPPGSAGAGLELKR
jgi:hypothetical protein